ncbi:hypothetical protein [Acetonema longum]|uniref:FMN-binding domain-containing protein n=1 Tax=Acetonema longum DSM 6540 TaxID=1009370 RepID=F7NPJ5_9FIRM|nr:hypothetical protein [Acetonema longum]EGO62035.1 FMN-binding domain-containing protein [Acetonema longum DSM 6540]
MSKMKMVAACLVLAMGLFALGGCSSPQTAQPAAEMKVFRGVGESPVFRVGPGKDKNGGNIYSLTYVICSALFDKDGKIIDVHYDGLELLSPNDVEHPTASKFSGWPGQAGFAGAEANTDETAAKQVAAWQTKRERGDKEYGMNWSEQVAVYQNFFKGKTVAEIEQWFAKNTSDLNGRPLVAKMTNPKDKEKYNKLTDAEKKALADVTSGATISLKDAHGDYIDALKKAYANKAEVSISGK